MVVGFALIAETLIKMNDESGGQAAIGIGMGMGLMQWRLLRNYVASSSKFFWSTVINFSLAFILRDIVASLINSTMVDSKITVEITIPFAVLFGAFLSGWLQYRFVFKGIMDKAGFWILYSVIGWLLATLITMSTTFINIKFGEHFPKVLVVFFALSCLSLGGPILGLITGQFIVPRIKSIRET